MEEQKVTSTDILKHYSASVLIYGIILLFLAFCPVYYQTIEEGVFDYISFFIIYYIAYIVIAPIILFLFKPKSVLESRYLSIFNYIKRQFAKNETTEQFLKNIEPKEDEKQAFMVLFVKSFFGFYCVSLLCNKYFPSFEYNIDFLNNLFIDAFRLSSGSFTDTLKGLMQYIIDTGDVWLQLIMFLTTLVLAISYLTELDLFKNKIKSVDTTPLGVLSCIICYYPMTILTDRFIQVTQDTLMPVANPYLLMTLNLLIILVNLGVFIAVLRLGTKSGNLTNRGIVTGFPYNIIRHPDYTMQICYIILTSIPLYLITDYSAFEKIFMTIATLAWIYIYYLRAITEERHLIKDPDYQQYVEKVKYRFIPKLF